MLRKSLVTFAAIAAFAAPLSAAGGDIVVEGKLPIGRDAAREMVSAITRPVDGQIARFHAPICPSSGMKVRSTSFVKPVGKQVIDGSVVIIDREALDQRPLWQIADYIAMRALTPTLVPESNTTPTVLRAFSLPAGEGPQTLTAADLAFLRSVYSHDGLMSAVAERPRLASEMAKEG